MLTGDKQMQQPSSSFLGMALATPNSTKLSQHVQTKPNIRHYCFRTPQASATPSTIIRSVSLPSPDFQSKSHTFEEACANPKFSLNPVEVGFLPKGAWKNEPLPFGFLVVNFFRKRNSQHCKFPFKLYNALVLTDKHPLFFQFVGVRWVTETVFVVDKNIFAKLLGVRSIDGSLFHQQGNFPSHGFVELSFEEATDMAATTGIQPHEVSSLRFLRHNTSEFVRNRQELNLELVKWGAR